MKVLFVLPDFSGRAASYSDYALGNAAFSCSRGSWLQVVEGLAKRGHEVAAFVLNGDAFTDTQAVVLSNLEEAASWARDVVVVACSWGNPELISTLNSVGITPRLWLKTHLDDDALGALDSGKIKSIIVPSDFARLYSLHSSSHRRIGRIYNPLSTAFAEGEEATENRFKSKKVVFAGNIGENKGAHRVLELWPRIRRELPDATLTMAGSPKLYDSASSLGPLGCATEGFEQRYITPLIEEFGSLSSAGVDFVGTLSPRELANLYKTCALGIANLNWSTSVETFGCAVVEMLSTQLPVIGFARGALIETAALSSAALLQADPSLDSLSRLGVQLLTDPGRLASLGNKGRAFVEQNYGRNAVLDKWESILSAPADQAFSLSGDWRCPGRLRYLTEVAVGISRTGPLYSRLLRVARDVKQKLRRNAAKK